MASVRKPNKKYVRFSWEQLDLQCEWQECNMTTDQLHSFLQHVDNHLHSEQEESSCRWRECSGYSGNKMELTMHVLFHAFHTKIKCFGKNLLKRKNIGACSFDQRARNIIPDVCDMQCHWEDCGVTFLSAETFYRHVDTHAEDNPKGNKLNVLIECKWQDCSSKFNSLYRLKEHMRCHTQERVMACPTCGSMFASRTKFFDHVKRQNGINGSEDMTFQCGYCSRKLASERLLRDHMRHHINHYKCPYCDMTCPTPSGIRRHVMYRHTESKTFKCTQCEYGCKSITDLRRHMERHAEEMTHCCEIGECTFRSTTAGGLNQHMRNVHDCNGEYPSFMCHLCDKLFTRGHYLTKHLVRKHHLRWPSGHCRFRYHMQEDGVYKLQTVRYESIELSDSMMEEEKNNEDCNKKTLSDGNFAQSNNQLQTEGIDKVTEKVVGVPVVVFMSGDNSGDKSQVGMKVNEQPLSVMELQTTDGSTYVTPDGSSVVYVNLQEPALSSALRTIQFVTKADDGSTTVQTAEVIADGGHSRHVMQL